MRDAIGADAARVLPLLDNHSFTFLIEDPATVWNLGAQRYQTIAERYLPLTPHRERLAIDLNIVDRYQNVYPTKQQTGTELFQLVHSAAANFARVALYFENSLLAPDLTLLPSAAAAVKSIEAAGAKVIVDSSSTVGLPWKGAALGGRTSLAGRRRRNRVAARREPTASNRRDRAWCFCEVDPAEWRTYSGARPAGGRNRVFVPERRPRHRGARPRS